MSAHPNPRLLNKVQIAAAEDRKSEIVPVPEWGGDVRVMSLSAADRGFIEAGSVVANGQSAALKVESLATYRQKLVAFGLVDENGERLYSNKEFSELDDQPGDLIERLASKVQELSGMGRFAKDADKPAA